MYQLLTEIPVPASAQFVSSDVLHVTSTFHDHVRNVRKTVSNSIVLNDSEATSSPMQDVGDEVAYTYSPSRARRAVLREVKNDGKPKRFVEIWNKSALVTSFEVTEKHGAFYTDDHVASLSFSPSETSLIYIAESNPLIATEDDPYRKFRYTPQFGEGIAGKRRPTIFLFCWKNGLGEPAQALTALSIASEALFGQAIFSPAGDTLYATGTTVLLISIADGTVKDLTPEDGNLYSWKVLNTDSLRRVVCSRSTPISPHELVLGEFSETGKISWRVLHKPTLPPPLKEKLDNFRASVIPIPERFPTETIVIQLAVAPRNEMDIRPCITMPHGGPHGVTTTAFNPANVALALEGYTLSLPNYTGSVGFGETAIRALLGNCGTLDVEDCIASTKHLIKLRISVEGPGKQFVMGGSHGGFLTGHQINTIDNKVIGQFPQMFSAAVARNPVMSAGELSSTDIPDWYFAEFGESYPVYSSPSVVELEQGLPPRPAKQAPPLVTPEMYARVYRASPIAHVDNVRASVLLLIGAADLRVAPTQGIEYYHALRQRAQEGTRIEMLVFDGESHPLEGVEASRIGWQAARDFFKWAERLV
ncbi:hypothetical protein C0992_003644 [Termitomyces sp. T32_za158]|nr:hypothetical protein C0992_003644 [Termitomyces sp. T32_za158]